MDEGDNLLKYMADYLQNVEKEYRYITYGRIEADIFAVCFSYDNEKEITDFVKKFTNQMEKYPLDFDITPFFGIYLVKTVIFPSTKCMTKPILHPKTVREIISRTISFTQKR